MIDRAPKTMKAVLLTGHGGFEKLEYREDVAVPALSPAEVLIKVGAAAINNTDINTRVGYYHEQRSRSESDGWKEPFVFPRIQGIDFAGRIVAVGTAVLTQRLGQRVVVDPLLGLPEENLFKSKFFGYARDGGFAEYVACPSENAIQIETHLDDAELASFPSAYATALHMLNRGRVAAGETIIITGASGGVGSGLIQLAKARGAKPLAIVGKGKESEAWQLGAEYVVTRHTPDLAKSVRQALGGRDADVLAEVVGGPGFEALIHLLRPEVGRCVVSGAIGGPVVKLDLRAVYMRHIDIMGSRVWTHSEFLELIRLIKAGQVKPKVARAYPLDDIRKAQQDFLEKNFFGKLVLIP